MNGIPVETANAPAAAPVEQPKQPKKPRVAAHAADVAPSKARSGHRATRAKKASARAGSKTAKVLELLKRSGGASLKELMKATGWQAHSVRGFLSGALGKKMGLTVSSARVGEDRRYSVKG